MTPALFHPPTKLARDSVRPLLSCVTHHTDSNPRAQKSTDYSEPFHNVIEF